MSNNPTIITNRSASKQSGLVTHKEISSDKASDRGEGSLRNRLSNKRKNAAHESMERVEEQEVNDTQEELS